MFLIVQQSLFCVVFHLKVLSEHESLTGIGIHEIITIQWYEFITNQWYHFTVCFNMSKYVNALAIRS